jgi:hypothetical protein
MLFELDFSSRQTIQFLFKKEIELINTQDLYHPHVYFRDRTIVVSGGEQMLAFAKYAIDDENDVPSLFIDWFSFSDNCDVSCRYDFFKPILNFRTVHRAGIARKGSVLLDR